MVILSEYYTFLVYLVYFSPLGLLWCNTQNDKRTGTMTEGATNGTEHEGKREGIKREKAKGRGTV